MKLKRGFSLVELITTIVVMLILLGAMVPMVDTQLLKSAVNSEAEKIAADLRLVQQFSLARENGYGYYGLQFYDDLDVGGIKRLGYKILRYEPNIVSLPIGTNGKATVVKSAIATDNPLIFEQNLIFDKRIAFSSGSRIKPAATNNRIIFTPQGSATSDGNNLLISNDSGANNEVSLQCGNGNITKKITISPVSGYVEIN